MDVKSNPVFSGTLGLLIGDLLGAGTNRIAKIITERAHMLERIGMKDSSDTLYKVLTLALHASMLALGTEFTSSAMPWLTESPSGFVCFMLGMILSNDALRENMSSVNSILWMPASKPLDASSS